MGGREQISPKRSGAFFIWRRTPVCRQGVAEEGDAGAQLDQEIPETGEQGVFQDAFIGHEKGYR